MNYELKDASDKAAFDRFINMMSGLMIKYGPIVLEKRRERKDKSIQEIDIDNPMNINERINLKEGENMDRTYEIPIWKKYTLSVEEAAIYFRIGENKLRNLINENKNADYLLWNGNRVQIKREKFERFVDGLEAI